MIIIRELLLVYCDYDSYQAPDSITLVGNQAGSYFIAPNIKATTRFYGALTGNVTGNCSGSSGSCTGNAATATKATQDGSGNVITSTYLSNKRNNALFGHNDYCRCVIALCKVTAQGTSIDSDWYGMIVRERTNGIVPSYVAFVFMKDCYSLAYGPVYSLFCNLENTGTTKVSGDGYRVCTFTYNGQKYAGLEFYQLQSSTFFIRGFGTFEPFGLQYYNMNTKAVLNTEVYNSITHGFGTRQRFVL